MKALRQRVEQVVRPVRASQWTKDRMREELLAHLESLYEQELNRSSSAAMALDEATRQLGEARALTRDLQASVSVLEKWASWPLPGSRWSRRRVSETVSAWVLRTTTGGSLASGLAIALVVVTLAAVEHRLDRLIPVTPFLLVVPALMWWSLVSLYGFCELIRREVERATPTRTSLGRCMRIAGLAASCVISAMAAPAVLAVMVRSTITYALFTNWQAALACLGWGTLMGVILAIQLRDWIVAARRYDNWESLELESDPAAEAR